MHPRAQKLWDLLDTYICGGVVATTDGVSSVTLYGHADTPTLYVHFYFSVGSSAVRLSAITPEYTIRGENREMDDQEVWEMAMWFITEYGVPK